MHFLPAEVIEARFNLKGDEGAVIEAAGTISKGMAGMGFIYTNKESISVGIGCLVSDFAESQTSPAQLLESSRSTLGRAADRRLRGQGICRASHSGRRLQGRSETVRRRLGDLWRRRTTQ